MLNLERALLFGTESLLEVTLQLFQSAEVPILWPEHLDVAIRFQDINFGVAPPDSTVSEAYLYVGPDHIDSDSFWNVPFGAALPVRELKGDDRESTIEAAAEFLREGLAHANG